MATPRTRLRLALLQLRKDGVPLRQEQSCFLERCRVARHQVTFINLADQPQVRWHHVDGAHAVLIGGAGDYSVTEEHPFTEPLRQLTLRLIEEGRPVFGSCWGHQFLAQISGGEVVEDPARTEIGSRRDATNTATRTGVMCAIVQPIVCDRTKASVIAKAYRSVSRVRASSAWPVVHRRPATGTSAEVMRLPRPAA